MSTGGRIAIITGAGSSRAYGFPDGPTLLKNVAEFPLEFDRSTHHWDSDEFGNWDAGVRRRIAHCTASSIDELVRENEEDSDFTTQCRIRIARQLLDAESSTEFLVTSKPADDWLRVLWSKMREVRTDDWMTRVSILTYNYDRLIERFFAQGFTQTLMRPPHLAQQDAKRLDVLHLHGSLGDLSETTDLSHRRVRWGHTLPFGPLHKLAPELRLYWQLADEATLQRAAQKLAAADTVAILGVSAALPRVAELVKQAQQHRTSSAKMTVLMTGLGLSSSELAACKSKFDGLPVYAEAYDENCSSLLRRIDWST